MRRARMLCVGIQFVSLACQLRADTLARPRETLLDLLLQLHVAEVDHVKRRCRSAVEIFQKGQRRIGCR